MSSSWLILTRPGPPSSAAASGSLDVSTMTSTPLRRKSEVSLRNVSFGTTDGTVPVSTHVFAATAAEKVSPYSSSNSCRFKGRGRLFPTTCRVPSRRSWTYALLGCSTSTAYTSKCSVCINARSMVPLSPPSAVHSVAAPPRFWIIRAIHTPWLPAWKCTSVSPRASVSSVTVTTGEAANTTTGTRVSLMPANVSVLHASVCVHRVHRG